jgi:hypothetical protein
MDWTFPQATTGVWNPAPQYYQHHGNDCIVPPRAWTCLHPCCLINPSSQRELEIFLGQEVWLERGPTHPERGVRTLSRTSDQDDGGSHGAQNPTPRDIFQYTRLFFEWGDDYDVCHSKGKKEGAREFKHLTDVLVQRGATLARDGRYFSTPVLERFIEEETVSPAERSFGFPLRCSLLHMIVLLMHLAGWAG